jgi:hypothetical protein
MARMTPPDLIPNPLAPADTASVTAPREPAAIHPKRRLWLRVLVAGPLVFVCAALVMAGGSLWLPEGRAKIDNLVLPIVLFPAIWAVLFFYACLDRRLARAASVLGALSLLHVAMITWHVIGSPT